MTGSLDFELDEDLLAVRELTAEIFADLASVDRVREVEANGGHDAHLWATLAQSGVLGIPLPEEAGGAGLGMLALVTVAEQQGRRVAPVRLAEVIAGAALPLAAFGTAEQHPRWLEPLLGGDLVVAGAWDVDASGAVVRASGSEDPSGGLVVTGRFTAVPALPVAGAVLVPVRLSNTRTTTVVVPTDRDGVRVNPESVTDRGSSGTLVLDGVRVVPDEVLPADGDEVARWTLTRLRVAQAAVCVGVCDEAVVVTAAYTSQREQFGRPLSTNQGVSLRAADAHIDTDAIRLSTLRAAWLLDLGRRDEAKSAALVASWWAKKAGLRVVHATQHLHGGIGADVDYPIHRYFLWGRQAAFGLGSAAAVLAELGDLLPTAPAIGAPA